MVYGVKAFLVNRNNVFMGKSILLQRDKTSQYNGKYSVIMVQGV